LAAFAAVLNSNYFSRSKAVFQISSILPPGDICRTEQEADAWAEGLRLDSVAGVFFGASNYYGYVARRP
jgi:hypothetical protein